MNAIVPADLIADAFTCSGSVTPASAPWKSQAISNLESRLAIRWAADRAKERRPAADIILDANGEQTTRDERDRAVFDAIGKHALANDIQAAADLPHAQVLDSIRRLVHAGYITRQRIGGLSVFTQAIGEPPEGLGDVPATRGTNATIASAAARKSAKAEKKEKVLALHDEGHSRAEIQMMTGLSKAYVLELIREGK